MNLKFSLIIVMLNYFLLQFCIVFVEVLLYIVQFFLLALRQNKLKKSEETVFMFCYIAALQG